MTISEVTGAFATALVLAAVVEAILEYLLGVWWKPLSNSARAKLLMAAGLVVGVSLSLAYRVDILATLGFQPSIVGQVVTGALIGRGADYLHGFWKKVKGS